ncbi:hypothetical protein [Janthinobacterium sp. PAMC25594]|uniref:hypothetical protein n=1 Tax=Janthinobacterium sp. PAMC25594 TaxID=2861284 RepID=UPI001C62BCD2|nr:hypothetical protein [Janthinobacterium sp. PAMC25594]QYG08961.1 hypothetical protein KY494_09565 [Janthinobacterium sp. PAMC25594]
MEEITTISTVSLETGISKEVLRKCEERYGLVPTAVEIWVGGAGVIALGRSPRGVNIMLTLQHLKEVLGKYRRSRSSMLARQQ